MRSLTRASAGQTLTISWINITGNGNVTMQGVALAPRGVVTNLEIGSSHRPLSHFLNANRF